MRSKPAEGTTDWVREKMAKGQSHAILKFLQNHPFPPGIPVREIVMFSLRDWNGKKTVTSREQKILFSWLGTGKVPDEDIRDVLVHGSAYTIVDLHRKRPDLLPAEDVLKYAMREIEQLLDLYFDRGRKKDKKLLSFIRKLDGIPGLAEIVAIRHVHHL